MEGRGLARMEGGWGHNQSGRLEEGVIMKYINKCEPPSLLYTVNDSNNQNSAYIKKITC